MTLRTFGMLCLVACSSEPTRSVASQAPSEPATTTSAPQAAAPPDAVGPRRMPAQDTALHARQAQLGASAGTCAGTATILANQGTASRAIAQWREATVRRLCTDDKWPEAVRQCVATADHDPLSCTGQLATDHQRERWNAAFDRWIDGAGP